RFTRVCLNSKGSIAIRGIRGTEKTVQRLVNTPYGHERGRIRCAGNRARPDEGFEPNVLRKRIGVWEKSQGDLQLSPVLSVGQEPPRGFRALLLQALEREHTAVMRIVGQQRNGGVVFAHGTGPPQAFVTRLFSWLGIGVDKEFHAVADNRLTLMEIQPALIKRSPRI